MSGLTKLSLFAPNAIRGAIRSDPVAMMGRAGGNMAMFKAYVKAMPRPANPKLNMLKSIARGLVSGGLMGIGLGALMANFSSRKKDKKFAPPNKAEVLNAAISTVGSMI